jgi:Ca2+-binding RTX toxin-like protein
VQVTANDGVNATIQDLTVTVTNLSGSFVGTAGGDTITGSSEEDTIIGLGGNDTLSGGLGNDSIDGGADADLITGGAGADILTGGLGADTFVIGAVTDLAAGETINGTTEAGTVDTLRLDAAGTYNLSTFTTLTNLDAIAFNTNASGFNLTLADSQVSTADANGDGTQGDLQIGASVAMTSAVTISGAGLTGTNRITVVGTNLGGADTITGGAGADTIDGGAGADSINGGAGADSLNGGAGADVLIGGLGVDAINTGAANDNLQDIMRFGAVTEFGDTISNFDVDGTDAQDDRIEFTGALNTAYDDRVNDDNFQFASGNGSDGGNTAANLNTTFEALYLSGSASEGVTNANLSNATAVATEFNAEFAITASTGEDALLVINDTDNNSFALWQYVENGSTAEIQAGELTLIGIFNANAAVSTSNFDLV